MAYGKRQLDPPALPAAAAPIPAHVRARRRREREQPGLFDRLGVARGWWRALGIVLFGAATLAELGSDPATAWFALPMLAVLAAAGGYGAYRALLDARRLARSATTPGVVSGVDDARRGLGAIERPTLRFISEDGREHEVAATYPERALRVGRSVRVRYDRADPAWAVVDDDGFRSSLTVWRGMALLMIPALLGIVTASARLLGV